MLLYLIPCILLLVVAIVLKKRESANKDNASANTKKSSSKKTTKKNVARTARSSQTQQNHVEDPLVAKQEVKPLSTDLKKNIEKLIAEKNYSTAEAKINQALNQDNTQHELYLYLIDVHLAQKDEFAVNQVINYIRSLGLNEIVKQAEERRKATQVEKRVDSIAFESSTPSAPEAKDTAAFDALIGNTEPSREPINTSVEKPASTHSPLEFSAPTITRPVEEIKQEQDHPLEFTLNPTVQDTPTEDFSLNATPATQENQAAPVVPLEFSFSQDEPVAPVEKSTGQAPEFKLDFAETTPSPAVEELKSASDIEFKLSPSETEAQPSFSFDLESHTETAVQTAPQAPTLSFEPAVATPSPSTQSNDPLVESFPELAEVNEAQLNLDLAQHYITLGAFTSARELLTQNESLYTPEQREKSQKLLNQIAS